ncbi:hypothetical protein K5D43_21740 [Pseudomonas cichorii]|nr:hypothetical protein [Pseudomonas cichorii]MBX8557103.1 hypothetical protein [Pseudomonas cichorii]
MSKPHSSPFTLEEDLSRLPDLLPTERMVEQLGFYLQNGHKVGAPAMERARWLGVCEGYVNALAEAQLLSPPQVHDLREIIHWAAQRAYTK